MRWISRNLTLVFLAAISIIAVVPLFVAWWASRQLTWATTLPLGTVATTWLTFLYHKATGLRVWWDMKVAEFSQREARISVQARFVVPDNLTYDDIVKVIRAYYVGATSPVKPLPASGRMVVDMPGWSARLVLSSRSNPEIDAAPGGCTQDLLFSVPDTYNSVRSAKRLLQIEVLPLLSYVSEKLNLPLEAVSLSLRFPKGINPYLSTYFANVDFESITSLRCVVRDGRNGETATITRDAITLAAANLLDINRLAQKHLGIS